MTICTHCHIDEDSVYHDWVPPAEHPFRPAKSINLCYKCAKQLGYISENIRLIRCVDCRRQFVPSLKSNGRCGLCWKKYFNKKAGGK